MYCVCVLCSVLRFVFVCLNVYCLVFSNTHCIVACTWRPTNIILHRIAYAYVYVFICVCFPIYLNQIIAYDVYMYIRINICV